MIAVLILTVSMPLTIQALTAQTTENIVEVEEYREEYTKHFLMPDGTYKAVTYDAPVHRMDENGVWQDIDNTMSESNVKNKQAFITSDERVVFSKKIDDTDNTVFELNENGCSIKLSFVEDEIKNTSAKLSNHAKKYEPQYTDDIETQYKKLKEIDNNTTVLYKNILKGIDLEYILSANDIKENIIIRKADRNEYSYTFRYELSGLGAKLNEDGSVSLYDVYSNAEKYIIPAPYMYDDAGEVSYDVAYTLNELGGGAYELTVTANADWINASERALPVTVDPTLYFQASYWDTYIDALNPSTPYGTASNLPLSSNSHVFMRHSIAGIPTNSNVISSELYVRYYYTVTSGNMVIGLYPATVSWNEYSHTYNVASEYTNLGISTSRVAYVSAPASSSITSSSPGTLTIDVTNWMKSLYAGTQANYGLVFKRISGSLSSVILKSYESGSATRAHYDVTYSTVEYAVDEGPCFIENLGSGKYIEIEGPSSYSGAIVQQWDFYAGNSQRWIVEHIAGSGGYSRIKSAYSNLYLGVDSNNTNFVKQYSAADVYSDECLMWRIDDTLFDSFTISNKATELGRSVLAVPNNSTANGTDLGQRDYTNDTNYFDEWKVHPTKDVSLIAYYHSNDTVDRSSYFDTILSYLGEIGYDNTFDNHNTVTNGLYKNDVLELMKYSKITLIRTHGGPTGIQITGGNNAIYLTRDEILLMPETTFEYSELIIYGACSTAEGGESANNMVSATVTAGARTVIGFQDPVEPGGCNKWCKKFFELYVDYYDDMTKNIEDVCIQTDNYMKTQFGYDGTAADGTWFSLERYVLAGEKSFSNR